MKLMVTVGCLFVTICLLLAGAVRASNGFVDYGNGDEVFSDYTHRNGQLVAEVPMSLRDFILDLVSEEEEEDGGGAVVSQEKGEEVTGFNTEHSNSGLSLSHKLLHFDHDQTSAPESQQLHLQGDSQENIEQLLQLLLSKGRHRLSDQNAIQKVNFKLVDNQVGTSRTKRLQTAETAPRINKRHCWNVADVCCMWNICNRRRK